MSTESLLTTKQAAAYLNLSERTLEQWRWEGKGPAFEKVGRLVRYRLSAIEAWLVQQRT